MTCEDGTCFIRKKITSDKVDFDNCKAVEGGLDLETEMIITIGDTLGSSYDIKFLLEEDFDEFPDVEDGDGDGTKVRCYFPIRALPYVKDDLPELKAKNVWFLG